ncbi:MAG: hypothetical protein Q9210_002898, partial [Variospora velana]
QEDPTENCVHNHRPSPDAAGVEVLHYAARGGGTEAGLGDVEGCPSEHTQSGRTSGVDRRKMSIEGTGAARVRCPDPAKFDPEPGSLIDVQYNVRNFHESLLPLWVVESVTDLTPKPEVFGDTRCVPGDGVFDATVDEDERSVYEAAHGKLA